MSKEDTHMTAEGSEGGGAPSEVVNGETANAAV